MRDDKIGEFLDRVADRVPAPGGGAAAALQAALGAALLAMVGRYSVGPDFAQHQETIDRVVAEADELRGIALRLAEADEAAFSAVAAAYRLPKTTDEEKATRSAAVAEAVVNAAWPPAQVIGVSSMVVDLAEALVLIGNRNVLSDLAAAAEAAGAAVATARVNVEIDLAGIEDAQASLEMIAQADKADDIIARARQVTAVVREKIRA